MRKWGTIISLAYAVFVVVLLVPAGALLGDRDLKALDFYEHWESWIVIGMVLAGQALLLFLSVDTSFRRNKPRAHIVVSSLVTAAMLALLSGAVVFCLGFDFYGEKFGDFVPETAGTLGSLAAIWIAWTAVFYHYYRNSESVMSHATSWLLKGSVLELLIAVPSHVLARRRHECSAPPVTSFGIATGIAIMLLSFGPSVLLLYKKRLGDYGSQPAQKRAAAKSSS